MFGSFVNYFFHRPDPDGPARKPAFARARQFAFIGQEMHYAAQVVVLKEIMRRFRQVNHSFFQRPALEYRAVKMA